MAVVGCEARGGGSGRARLLLLQILLPLHPSCQISVLFGPRLLDPLAPLQLLLRPLRLDRDLVAFDQLLILKVTASTVPPVHLLERYRCYPPQRGVCPKASHKYRVTRHWCLTMTLPTARQRFRLAWRAVIFCPFASFFNFSCSSMGRCFHSFRSSFVSSLPRRSRSSCIHISMYNSACTQAKPPAACLDACLL